MVWPIAFNNTKCILNASARRTAHWRPSLISAPQSLSCIIDNTSHTVLNKIQHKIRSGLDNQREIRNGVLANSEHMCIYCPPHARNSSAVGIAEAPWSRSSSHLRITSTPSCVFGCVAKRSRIRLQAVAPKRLSTTEKKLCHCCT